MNPPLGCGELGSFKEETPLSLMHNNKGVSQKATAIFIR